MDGAEVHKNDFRAANFLRKEGKLMASLLKSQMLQMGLQDRGELLRKMNVSFRYQYGAVEALRFGTTRYGLMKIHGIKAGTIARRRDTRSYEIRQKAPQDWWNAVAKTSVPKLAAGLARIRADLAVKVSEAVEVGKR